MIESCKSRVSPELLLLPAQNGGRALESRWSIIPLFGQLAPSSSSSSAPSLSPSFTRSANMQRFRVYAIRYLWREEQSMDVSIAGGGGDERAEGSDDRFLFSPESSS